MNILGYLFGSRRQMPAAAPKAKAAKPGPKVTAKPAPVVQPKAPEGPQPKPFVMPPPARLLAWSIQRAIENGGLFRVNPHDRRRIEREASRDMLDWITGLTDDDMEVLRREIRLAEIDAARFMSRKREQTPGDVLHIGDHYLNRVIDDRLIHDIAARDPGAAVEALTSAWLTRAKASAAEAAAADAKPPAPAPVTPPPKGGANTALLDTLAILGNPAQPDEPEEAFPFDLEDDEPEELPPETQGQVFP